MELRQIAHIRNDYRGKFGIPRQSGLADNISTIVFEPQFRDANALRCIEGFSFLWLLWGFSEVRGVSDGEPFRPTVRPPRLGGSARVGVFASRSPFRPNPIGISSVSLVSVSESEEGPVIVVSGADLMDGTPIYDIKPYLPQFDSHPDAKAGYVDLNEFQVLSVVFPPALLSLVPERKRDALVQALSQDSRPHYQDEDTRVYGMEYGDMDIRFTVSGTVLTVVGVVSE